MKVTRSTPKTNQAVVAQVKDALKNVPALPKVSVEVQGGKERGVTLSFAPVAVTIAADLSEWEASAAERLATKKASNGKLEALKAVRAALANTPFEKAPITLK